MNFARMARMSPRQRMLAAMNGHAMSNLGLEISDGASGVYAGLSGLGLSIDTETAPATMSIAPITPTTRLAPTSAQALTIATTPIVAAPTAFVNSFAPTPLPSVPLPSVPKDEPLMFAKGKEGGAEISQEEFEQQKEAAREIMSIEAQRAKKIKQTVAMVRQEAKQASVRPSVPVWVWFAGAIGLAYLVAKE